MASIPEYRADDVLTVTQVASYLQVSERTVFNWIRLNRLPVYRYGRCLRIKFGSLKILAQRNDAAMYEDKTTNQPERG